MLSLHIPYDTRALLTFLGKKLALLLHQIWGSTTLRYYKAMPNRTYVLDFVRFLLTWWMCSRKFTRRKPDINWRTWFSPTTWSLSRNNINFIQRWCVGWILPQREIFPKNWGCASRWLHSLAHFAYQQHRARLAASPFSPDQPADSQTLQCSTPSLNSNKIIKLAHEAS